MRRAERRRDDRGAATVLALALVALLVTVAVAAVGVAGIVVTHRRAQAAADLAALAGAQSLGRGKDGCAVAARVARANGGRLDSCQPAGMEVTVEVSVAGPRLLGAAPRMHGRARAGPTSAMG